MTMTFHVHNLQTFYHPRNPGYS